MRCYCWGAICSRRPRTHEGDEPDQQPGIAGGVFGDWTSAAVGPTMAAGQLIGGWLGAHTAVRRRPIDPPVFLTVVIGLAIKLGWDAVVRR